MSLRGDWQQAKATAEKETTKKPFPVKFKEDLGPTLDKWEKARPSPEKNKLAGKALEVIKAYKTAIANEHALSHETQQKLATVLKTISEKVEALHQTEERGEHKQLESIIVQCNNLIPQLENFRLDSETKDKLWVKFHAEVVQGLGDGFPELGPVRRSIIAANFPSPSKREPNALPDCVSDLKWLVECCKKQMTEL